MCWPESAWTTATMVQHCQGIPRDSRNSLELPTSQGTSCSAERTASMDLWSHGPQKCVPGCCIQSSIHNAQKVPGMLELPTIEAAARSNELEQDEARRNQTLVLIWTPALEFLPRCLQLRNLILNVLTSRRTNCTRGAPCSGPIASPQLKSMLQLHHGTHMTVCLFQQSIVRQRFFAICMHLNLSTWCNEPCPLRSHGLLC
mmetsp:Transcript_61738/g.116679  ORF Transcript_61738/g.116679 Transcript_61738/m.116679 type:complete len:201 (+) Transcript_61738:844-1446(+)